MKQLFIVNSQAKANGGLASPQDISGMPAGSIGFYALSDTSKWLSAKATEKFAIVYGKGESMIAAVLPEVDINTLSVSMSEPAEGVKYKAVVTIPTPQEGCTYTLVLTKLKTVFHERNRWTATVTVPKGKSMTAGQVADQLATTFSAMADTGSLEIVVTHTTGAATITIESVHEGITYRLLAADDLYVSNGVGDNGSTAIVETQGTPAIGDQAYIQDLASRCAGDKGFYSTYRDGDSIYPGYPEVVEDVQYNVFNLRFAVGRDFGKQDDQRAIQMVHIAVPTTSALLSSIKTILGVGASAASQSDDILIPDAD